MLNHSSATPHTIKSTNNNTVSRQKAGADGRRQGHKGSSKTNLIKRRNGTSKTTISNALRRRAHAIINDKNIDAESRAIIRYGLEINDPWLPELVRRLDAGEAIIETIVLIKHPKPKPRIQQMKRSKL